MSARATPLDCERQARILIVEDEPMLAFVLEETLIDAGFEIAGVAGRLETALAMIDSEVFDAAVLDANLAGVSAGQAAAALTARKAFRCRLGIFARATAERVFRGASAAKAVSTE